MIELLKQYDEKQLAADGGKYGLQIQRLTNKVNEVIEGFNLLAAEKNNPHLFDENHVLAEAIGYIQASSLQSSDKLFLIGIFQMLAYAKTKKMSPKETADLFKDKTKDDIKKWFKTLKELEPYITKYEPPYKSAGSQLGMSFNE